MTKKSNGPHKVSFRVVSAEIASASGAIIDQIFIKTDLPPAEKEKPFSEFIALGGLGGLSGSEEFVKKHFLVDAKITSLVLRGKEDDEKKAEVEEYNKQATHAKSEEGATCILTVTDIKVVSSPNHLDQIILYTDLPPIEKARKVLTLVLLADENTGVVYSKEVFGIDPIHEIFKPSAWR